MERASEQAPEVSAEVAAAALRLPSLAIPSHAGTQCKVSYNRGVTVCVTSACVKLLLNLPLPIASSNHSNRHNCFHNCSWRVPNRLYIIKVNDCGAAPDAALQEASLDRMPP